MSATFKLAAKKKYTQNDLRRLMNEQKAKATKEVASARIDSPLAKYPFKYTNQFTVNFFSANQIW